MLDACVRLEAQVGVDACGREVRRGRFDHLGAGSTELADHAPATIEQLERDRGAIHVAPLARRGLHRALDVGIAHRGNDHRVPPREHGNGGDERAGAASSSRSVKTTTSARFAEPTIWNAIS